MRFFVIVFALILGAPSSLTAQTDLIGSAFENGTRLAKTGQFEAAEKQFRRGLAIANNDWPSTSLVSALSYNIGVCVFRNDRASEAIGYFREAIRLRRGKYPKASYALGLAELQNGGPPRAKAAFLDALRGEPENGEWWFDLAFAYLWENDHENAALAFHRSIVYNNADSDISHNNLGVMLALKKDFDAAEREFNAALATRGDGFVEAKSNLEICRAAKRDSVLTAAQFKFANRGKVLPGV